MEVRGVSTVSKVIAFDTSCVKLNENEGMSLVRQLKFFVILESVVGISRLYLLQCHKVVRCLNYIYVAMLAVVSLYIILQSPVMSQTHRVFRDVMCAEYIFLVINAMFMKKQKFLRFFQNLSTFDELLNISRDTRVLNSTTIMVFWTLGSICYSVIEFVIFLQFIRVYAYSDHIVLFFYMLAFAHDLEQILFFTLMRMIYKRIIIVRTHICKTFRMDVEVTNDNIKLNKIESLSKNTTLDICSVYKVYELLHKCSDQLNTIMGIPMLIMLFTAGLLTTISLKFVVTILQNYGNMKPVVLTAMTIYVLARAVKYTLLVIIPCYYASVTSQQVSIIRTTLYNAVNTMPLDKLERRRMKAFYLLTKENEFTYALAGVIKLNMSLPLSYLSLCITYLFIIIQFSKFID